jgi:hypothetical protein
MNAPAPPSSPFTCTDARRFGRSRRVSFTGLNGVFAAQGATLAITRMYARAAARDVKSRSPTFNSLLEPIGLVAYVSALWVMRELEGRVHGDMRRIVNGIRRCPTTQMAP